jgi:chitinase
MKSISKLALASSMTILLAGCGGGSGGDKDTSTPSANEAINSEIETGSNEETVTEVTDQQESNIPSVTPPSSGNTSEEPLANDQELSANESESTDQSETQTESEVEVEAETEVETETEQEAESQEANQGDQTTNDITDNAVIDSNPPNISEGSINSEYLSQVEAELTDTPLMLSVKASIATIDNALVEQISPLSSSNPSNVQRLESILSANDWEYIFPKRAPEYSYDKFLKAVGKFPAFCGDYDDGRDADAICRKSLATMFAHFTQETGGHTAHWDVQEWRQGLVHVREMAWDETMQGGYNGECAPDLWQGKAWPCGTFENGEYKSYFGRGAKQLSYNYNYGPFSEAMFGDVSVLLERPDLVADTWLNLASAVFFYVYPQPPKPSMLHVIDGTWQPNDRDISNGLVSGFGVTTQIINGGVECGGQTEIAQSLNRISYYQSVADYLGVEVPSDEVLGCAGMKQFDNDGDGALNIYWEQDWSYVAENPGGESFACKLVGYQTPFSAFKEGDYSLCVQHHFDVTPVNTTDGTQWIDEEQPISPPEENIETTTPSEVEPEVIIVEPEVIVEPEIVVETESGTNESSVLVAPASPTIGWMADAFPNNEASINVSWNMWWGTNASTWSVELDSEEVYTNTLTVNDTQAQSGNVNITVEGEGSHSIVVYLCNGEGNEKICSSDTRTITLTGSTDTNSTETVTESGTPGGSNESTEPEAEVEYVAGMYGDQNKVYAQTSGKVVVSYFVEWGVYGRDYHVNDIPAGNLTHLLYGFLAICGDNPQATSGAKVAIQKECASKQDNEITIIDSFATLEKTYPGDTWLDNVRGDQYNGNFGQLRKLKEQNPDLKILPSVGGWTLSTPFFAMAKDANKRTVFVNSVVKFLKQYEFFDGVDIDWEYPGVDGADIGYASSADRDAYTALMRDLRAGFDTLSIETGRDYEVTSAVGAGPATIDAVNYTEAHQYMDYIFMMTYDYAGAWEGTTGHHTALYPNQEINEGFNASDAVERMLSQGVPSQKLVIGAAMYARAWSGVTNSNDHAEDLFPLYGEGSGPAKGTWEAGVYDYKDIYTNFIGSDNQGINGFTVHYDETAEAAYLWNESTGEFITYDSPRSIKAKADFIERYNLGGFLSWEIDADNGLLLNAMNSGLGNAEIK